MIILDLDENENLVAKIKGKRDAFYKGLYYIKSIKNSKYQADKKLWVIPRKLEIINNLEKKFKVCSELDKYILAGKEPPYIETAADRLLAKVTDVNSFLKSYQLGELKDILKDFQKLGVACALYFQEQYQGFLIADDMGLGKTVQAIAVMRGLKAKKGINKFIVSCPKNVKYQWSHEIERFSKLKPVVVDGHNKETRLEKFKETGDIYIINHEQLIIAEDYQGLKDIKADFIVIDEIHKFKNRKAKRTKALVKFRQDIKYVLGLTGTPMQNNPEDIYSIYKILIPELLGAWKDFSRSHILYSNLYGFPYQEGYINLHVLKQKISPYMIRRDTEYVSEELPKLKEETIFIEMSAEQKKLNNKVQIIIQKKKDLIDELRNKLGKTRSKKEKQNIFNQINKEEEFIMGLIAVQIEISDSIKLLTHSKVEWIKKLTKGIKISKSKKLLKLKELVKEILVKETDYKVIIFSKFAQMVKLIAKELQQLEEVEEIATIYGNKSEQERDKAIQNYLDNVNCRVLVSSDAGCEGINLQNSSHLINYDLPWNPATLDQRRGRIRRIGSYWENIYVYNFISKKSIDESILDAIAQKKKWFDLIVSNSSSQEKALKGFVDSII